MGILAKLLEHISEEADGCWWAVPKDLTKHARFPLAVDLRMPLLGRARAIVERRLKAVGASGLLFEDVRSEHYAQHDFSTYIYGLQPHAAKATRRKGTAGLSLPGTLRTPHNLLLPPACNSPNLVAPEEVAEAILGHLPKVIFASYNAYSYGIKKRLRLIPSWPLD